MAAPGTITAILEPIFEGSLDGLPPGSNCIANAYTNNYEKLHSGALLAFAAFLIEMTAEMHWPVARTH